MSVQDAEIIILVGRPGRCRNWCFENEVSLHDRRVVFIRHNSDTSKLMGRRLDPVKTVYESFFEPGDGIDYSMVHEFIQTRYV